MKYLFSLLTVLSVLPTQSIYAHESPEPIDIKCFLENHIKSDGDEESYYQKLNPVISSQMVRDHYDLEGGMPNAFYGGLLTKIFVRAEIQTKQGIISKSGRVTAKYDKKSQGLEILHQLFGAAIQAGITVHWEYPDKESYEDSFSNSVVSCSLFP